jgi:5'(3')-deoxyribonucleotidase
MSQKLPGKGREFVLGVDLDGVVADFYAGIRPVAAEWLGVPVESLEKMVSYGLGEWGLATDHDYKEFKELQRFAVTQKDFFRKLRPIDGAAATLRKLAHRHGLRIRIITHRLMTHYTHQLAAGQTTEWLDSFGIPYWDLCFMKDKVAVEADLYIEDAPPNIVALREADKDVIVYANSTNRGMGPQRADTWKEVEALVLKKYAEWKKCGEETGSTSYNEDMDVKEELLVSDFQQCFEQMRHYDDGFRETVGFGFGGVLAVVAAYAALVGTYGLKPVVLVALGLLTLLGSLMGTLLVMWLARNRVYYAFVCRYVNEIRCAYTAGSPGGVQNKAGMYTDVSLPPILNPWSTQTLQVYFLSLCTALLFAGSLGTFLVEPAIAAGGRPEVPLTAVVLAFLLFAALEIGGVLAYWAQKDKQRKAEKAVWPSKS